ncbi:MAG TPA: hypothetical protein PK914_10700 [Smithellaceae bacterium]|nr:hypothetical protein [Smithellaceae bacterium]
MENILIFIVSMLLLVKGATMATKYSARLAESFHLSKYIVGFVIVAFISILPETLISINSAIEGTPEFGLGTLFGSNVADLSLIFAILIIYAGRGLKIESKVLKNVQLYPFFLLLPLLFGLNGHYSRVEGIFLIVAGILFYYLVFKNGIDTSVSLKNGNNRLKSFFFFIIAMVLLLIGSHFTLISSIALAHALKITPILIGMLVVSLGTTMPELFFSLKAIKKKGDGLAVGDIMGSVLADATIVVGVLATISPFSFPIKIIYITGVFMAISSFILLKFMKTGKLITKNEGYLLLAFWIFYVIVEFLLNK